MSTCACTETSSADTGSSQTRNDRLDRECPGDADPLPLSARELVGVATRHRGVEPDFLEQGADPRRDLLARHDAMDLQALGDRRADGEARIERAVRILEDDLHPPPHRAERLPVEAEQVLAFEAHRPGGGRMQPEHGAPEAGLPAAGFAHQGERLALDRTSRLTPLTA